MCEHEGNCMWSQGGCNMAISTISHPLFDELGFEKIDFEKEEKSKALLYYEEVILGKNNEQASAQ